MDESSGTNACDVTEYRNDGALSGCLWVSSMTNFGSALQFDGNGDYVSIPSNPLQNPPVNPELSPEKQISVSAWVCWEESTVFPQVIVSKDWEKYALLIASGPKLQFKWQDSTNGWHYASADFTAYKGVWTHVAAVYDGQASQLFIDGVKVAEIEEGAHLLKSSSGSLGIGGRGSVSPGGACFCGLIDEVRIYDVGISEGMVRVRSLGF
jgi:hypothetical protein